MQLFSKIRKRYVKHCMDAPILMLLLLGVWPLSKDESNVHLKRLRFLPYLGVFGLFFHSVFSLYDISCKLNDYDLLSETVSINVLLIKAVFRVFWGIFKINRLQEIVQRLDDVAENLSDEEKTIFKRIKSKAQWLTVVYVTAATLLGYAYILQPLLETSRRFPVHFQLPFEAISSPMYEVIYVMCLIIGPDIALCNSVGDSFVLSALIYVIGYFRILQYRLEHIRAHVEKKIVQSKEKPPACIVVCEPPNNSFDISNLPEHMEEQEQTCIDKDVNVAVISMDTNRNVEKKRNISVSKFRQVSKRIVFKNKRTKPTLKVTIGKRKMVNVSMSAQRNYAQQIVAKSDLDVAMERNLVNCVELHEYLIRLVHFLQELMSIPLFFEVAVASATICLSLFQTYTSTTTISMILLMRLGLLVLIFVQMLAFFWASNEIAVESSNVVESMYFSDWLGTPESYKRSMQIIMSRAKKPLQLTAAGFIPINLEVYRNILNTGYSYFKVALQLHTKK